jgi:hypothetical protein
LVLFREKEQCFWFFLQKEQLPAIEAKPMPRKIENA